MFTHRKIRTLCFLDDDYGRDVEILFPVIYFSEKYLNCSIEFAFIWDIHAIYRKKPDLVLLANTVGSKLHYEISRYACQNNIKVFALISEGNFRTDGTFDIWGYNKVKKFFQEYVCLWSSRTRDYMTKELPGYKDRMVVTGATGFDRYSIYEFRSKEEYLRNKKLNQFKKVIVYAGWAFGKLYNKQGFEELSYLHLHDEKIIEWIEIQMYKVEDILRKAIENNPDILFILKRHPNELNPTIIGEGMNEMVRLKQYPNVLYITENENIHDLINISDLWMGFETTTALEAWLIKEKNTILINPDPDFLRDNLYQGSIIIGSYNELQEIINEYYSTGKIDAFHVSEKKNKRRKLIEETIGFGDGLNHLRAGYYLKQVTKKILHQPNKKIKFSLKFFIMYCLMETGKFFYFKPLFLRLPKFKKTVWIFERLELRNIPYLKEKYFAYLSKYYKEYRLNEKLMNEKFLEKLIS